MSVAVLGKGSALDNEDKTAEGSEVLFEDHVEHTLSTSDKGALALPKDVKVSRNEWVTKPEKRTAERKKLSAELIARGIQTYYQMHSKRTNVSFDFICVYACNPRAIHLAQSSLRSAVRFSGSVTHLFRETLTSLGSASPDRKSVV